MNKFGKINELNTNPYKSETRFKEPTTVKEVNNQQSIVPEHINSAQMLAVELSIGRDKKVPFSFSCTRSNEEYIESLVKQGINKSEFLNKLIKLVKEGTIKLDTKENR